MLEKEYGKSIVGDDQLEMTSFQKQVLLLEEQRQNEQAQEQHGAGNSPSGALNAEHPNVAGGQSERVKFKNSSEQTRDDQATFVDTE